MDRLLELEIMYKVALRAQAERIDCYGDSYVYYQYWVKKGFDIQEEMEELVKNLPPHTKLPPCTY